MSKPSQHCRKTYCPETYCPETLALSAGFWPDQQTQATTPHIAMSVNHSFVPEEGSFSANGIEDLADAPFLYAGWTNPTVRQLEQRIAALECTDDAYATTTGMAALSAVFFSLLRAGDHLIISDVCYAAVYELARDVLPDYGIEVTPVNLTDLDAVAQAIRPNTKLIHAESPCNPLLRLTDLTQLVHLAKQNHVLLSVDSTFATPVITRPVMLGVDLVIHSLTKFINGHGDALGGCVAGSKALIAQIRSRAAAHFGATISAQNAWLIMRGIETLYPRMKTISDSALQIAQWLENHPRVKQVNYPGLASHPQYTLACEQMAYGGGIIVFQIDAMDEIAQRFARDARLFYYAYSIGHQRSLAVLLKTADLMASTYRMTTEQEQQYRRYAGDGVFRLSIGLENPHDLIEELDRLLC
ncbi:PLP-dependent aspartate aminotransferase family protein [Vibrio gazogenes]|uniref:Methionine-gamma-lyase n=1 Tax=Vibrio gazogenes DSM 21264 = NBRC 103151 TaxID=1123492 RepID=A0A1M4YJI3_VIBGA|nr:aminotransferase class I/II-fold pyridoxal phosphate-dependent enzyme [Vibrio gazogenes]USP15009.1 aminotransferase class I/II-fold pyridoxal phosphate-dependent enzyme [Vibrio gazogenes]SHF06015.1 methionine-gamma-lyase [Vibrio gazogenes DSM 21264] [Vibrio gazogenes DSM 21264 = NBRC 103151]SJN56431.1 Cystathionine gamma-lyase [Vibrio gazogenes]